MDDIDASLQHESESNPYRPPRVESTGETSSTGLQLRIACAIQAIAIIVGLAVEHVDHRTIVGSGPVLFLIGCVVTFLARRQQNRAAAVLGISAPALCVIVFFLINWNEWGPEQGDQPITIMAYVYSVISLPLAAYVILPTQVRQA